MFPTFFPPLLSISSFHLFLHPSVLGSNLTTASTYPVRRELVLWEVLLAGPISSGYQLLLVQ